MTWQSTIFGSYFRFLAWVLTVIILPFTTWMLVLRDNVRDAKAEIIVLQVADRDKSEVLRAIRHSIVEKDERLMGKLEEIQRSLGRLEGRR